MAFNLEGFKKIKEELSSYNAELVAVSKTKTETDILKAYDQGQRIFGENYVQELVGKYEALPKDIRWHFIGHLQTNKVKYITPFVDLIHGVDRLKLLKEINKQGKKVDRVIPCLLQVHIADEATKFGLNRQELFEIMGELKSKPETYQYIELRGLMGMATHTEDPKKIRAEFRELKKLLDELNNRRITTLSMGMSGDYKIALEEGSSLIRIGSLIFGARKYPDKQ